jgi:hypothetical protein
LCAVEAGGMETQARAGRPHPRCPGGAGIRPRAYSGSAWRRRTGAGPPRATRPGPAAVLARTRRLLPNLPQRTTRPSPVRSLRFSASASEMRNPVVAVAPCHAL